MREAVDLFYLSYSNDTVFYNTAKEGLTIGEYDVRPMDFKINSDTGELILHVFSNDSVPVNSILESRVDGLMKVIFIFDLDRRVITWVSDMSGVGMDVRGMEQIVRQRVNNGKLAKYQSSFKGKTHVKFEEAFNRKVAEGK